MPGFRSASNRGRGSDFLCCAAFLAEGQKRVPRGMTGCARFVEHRSARRACIRVVVNGSTGTRPRQSLPRLAGQENVLQRSAPDGVRTDGAGKPIVGFTV